MSASEMHHCRSNLVDFAIAHLPYKSGGWCGPVGGRGDISTASLPQGGNFVLNLLQGLILCDVSKRKARLETFALGITRVFPHRSPFDISIRKQANRGLLEMFPPPGHLASTAAPPTNH